MSNSKNYRTILWIVKSAMLLALLVAIQFVTYALPASLVPLVKQLITGSLVNLVLIIGAGSVGFAGAGVAAVLSPVLAFAFAQMTFPPLIPIIMVGNLILVAITWGGFRTGKGFGKFPRFATDLGGVIVGSAVKAVFLWAAISFVAIPLILHLPAPVAAKVSLMFSWPQLVTSLVGGVLALAILPAIRAYQKGIN